MKESCIIDSHSAVPLCIIAETERGLCSPPSRYSSWIHILITSPSSKLPVEFSKRITAPINNEIIIIHYGSEMKCQINLRERERV